MAYWQNTVTGEVIESTKRPNSAYRPASTSYGDKMEQQKREQGAIAELRKVIDMYGENYGKGMESNALAAASASAIQSGLGNTTRPGAISAGLKSQFEDMRMGRLSEAMNNLASFLGGYRDPSMTTPIQEASLGQNAQQFAQSQGQQASQFNKSLQLELAKLNMMNRPVNTQQVSQPGTQTPNYSSIWGQTSLNSGSSYTPLDTSKWSSLYKTDYVGSGGDYQKPADPWLQT